MRIKYGSKERNKEREIRIEKIGQGNKKREKNKKEKWEKEIERGSKNRKVRMGSQKLIAV